MFNNKLEKVQTKTDADLALEQYLVEAARYALLRRMAPSIRHNMAGSIQPVTMTAALLKRRLQKSEFERASLEKTADDICILARQATQATVESMLWFAPQADSAIGLSLGLSECLLMLQTPLSFQGFEINLQALDQGAEARTLLVAKNSLRCVFSTALLAITDSAAAAEVTGTVVIDSQLINKRLLVTIALENVYDFPGNQSTPAYRNILAADAQVIAAAESVGLTWALQTMRAKASQEVPLQDAMAKQVLTSVKLDFECLPFVSSPVA